MKQSRASIRYAKAFLQVADKQNSLDSAAADMQKVASITAESKDLVTALENPMASTSVKKAIVDEVFAGVSDVTKDLLRVLSENDRLDLLDDVAHRFAQLLAAHRGQIQATLMVASSENQKDQEAAVLKLLAEQGYSNVLLDVQIDPELIGGLVLKLDDLRYDASIAGKIKRVKKEFSNSL